MSCRSTPAGSAATSYARYLIGGTLSDPAMTSTFHELRRDYRESTRANLHVFTDEEYRRILRRYRRRVRDMENISEARRRSITTRLDSALASPIVAQDIVYALSKLEGTVQERDTSIRGYTTDVASRMGVSPAAALQRFMELEQGTDRISHTRTQAIDTDVRAFARSNRFGSDAGVMTALARLEEEARAVEATRAGTTVQRITRTVYPQPLETFARGVYIRSAGYDPRNGRLEVETCTRTGRNPQVHAYRNVPPGLLAQSNAGSSFQASWFYHVRGISDYEYATEHEAMVDGCAPRCEICGQFSAVGHTCPARRRGRPRNNPATTPTPAPTPAPPTPATPTVAPARRRTATTFSRYSADRRWTRQTAMVEDLQHNGGARRSVAAVERGCQWMLPPVRALRAALQEGPVRLTSVSEYIRYNYAYRRGASLSRMAARMRGSVRIDYDANGELDIDMGSLQCSCHLQRDPLCPHQRSYYDALTTRVLPASARRARQAGAAGDQQVTLTAAQRRAEAAWADDWMRTPATAEEAARTWRADTTVLYSQNPEAFKEDINAAVARRAAKNNVPDVPYMTENALDGECRRGSHKAFGMEIEFDIKRGTNRSSAVTAIARELYEAGITSTPTQRGYQASQNSTVPDKHTSTSGKGTWSFERDGSVSGGELVTPRMYDEPETWVRLAKAVEIIKRHGGVPSTHAGAHVHVGTGEYQGNVAAYTELARMIAQHEDVYFRLASDPARGTHRGPDYAGQVNDVPARGFADITSLRRWQGGRYTALNVLDVRGNAKDHPEFRIFDSTLDVGTMQAQIKLAVATTAAAKRTADSGRPTRRGKEEWGSHTKRSEGSRRRGRMSNEDFEKDTTTVRSLLDTLFRRREDKAQLAAVFANTKWTKPPALEYW